MPDISREEYREGQIEKLTQMLHDYTFFDEFPEIAADFARRAKFGHFEQGTKIIRQGTEGDGKFYVVMGGQLRTIEMTDDPPRILNYHVPVSIVGTRALLDDTPRAATVEVIADADLAIFSKEDWNWLIHQNDRIEEYFRNLEREFERPSLATFPGQQWDEVIVIAVKRHILAFFAKLPVPLALLIVPVLFLIAAELWGFRLLTTSTNDLILTALVVVPFVVLAVGLTIFYYIDWHNDDFIVTTKRVIHIERILLYGEQRDEAPLTRIQDVTVLSYDLIERFFEFHDLEIKTAGAGIIKINGVPRAEEIREAIFREQARAKARVGAADVGAVRGLIAKRLDWEKALEKPTVRVAEAEGTVQSVTKTHRLPGLLDYLYPRVKEFTEDKDGGTVIVWRKHYFILLTSTFFPLVTFLISFYFFMAALVALPPFENRGGLLILLLTGVATLGTLFWYLLRYDGWERDRYMVTNNRIVDVESTPFRLHGEQRREGTFDHIQNITYDIPNLVSQLLNLGDVIIETAGTERTFTFEKVFDPSGVQEEIFHRMVLYQQNQREKMRDLTAKQTVEIIAEYHNLLEKTTLSRQQPRQ